MTRSPPRPCPSPEKTIDELRDLATDYGIEADGLEHSDLVLKLLDAVPLAQAS